MSYTEVYKVGKDGDFSILGETQNSHHGAMAVWLYLEKKYLPPYLPSYYYNIPESLRHDVTDYTRFSSSGDDELEEFWNLVHQEHVELIDKIVLASTYDNVVVMLKDIPTLLDAYKKFEGKTSLKEQAQLIENAIANDNDIIAIAWNQTSVNANPWESWGEDAEEPTPYNMFTGTQHRIMWDNPN